MPTDPFSSLQDNYFSLGQSRSYYEQLNQLTAAESRFVFTSLRDVTLKPKLRATVEDELAYTYGTGYFEVNAAQAAQMTVKHSDTV